jgi:hypothetical protein
MKNLLKELIKEILNADFFGPKIHSKNNPDMQINSKQTLPEEDIEIDVELNDVNDDADEQNDQIYFAGIDPQVKDSIR